MPLEAILAAGPAWGAIAAVIAAALVLRFAGPIPDGPGASTTTRYYRGGEPGARGHFGGRGKAVE